MLYIRTMCVYVYVCVHTMDISMVCVYTENQNDGFLLWAI